MKLTELINMLGDVGKEEGDIQVRCGSHKIAGLAVVRTEVPPYVAILTTSGLSLVKSERHQ